MDEGLTISPTEIYTTKWNGEIRQYEKHPIQPEDFVAHFWDEVEFEGDVTLGRLFSLIGEDDDSWELILREHVVSLVAEMNNPKEDGEPEDPNEIMDYLELHWWAETEEVSKGGKVFQFHFPSFHGVGTCKEDQLHGYKKGESIHWGVSFTPVYKMKNLPVRLNTKVELYTQSMDKVGEKCPEPEKVYLGEKSFTLIEVIKGIFWELCWYGSPSKRNALKDHLKQEMKGIEDGSIETFPFDPNDVFGGKDK